MKRNQILLIVVTGLFLLLYSCEKDFLYKDKGEDGKGYLSLNLELTITRLKSSQTVNTDDFTVEIYDDMDNLVDEYPRYADLPDPLELEVGTYYVKIHSNNLVPAAFDNPYYEGVSDLFEIFKGETKTVDVTAELANVKVTVEYSAEAMADFSNFITVVSTGTDSLVYIDNDTRAGYFEVTPLSVRSYLIFPMTGSTDTIMLTGEIADPQPKDHILLTIDGSLSDGGLNSISLTVDESVNEVDITLSNTVYNTFIDTRDGQEYKWIQIGNQIWMAENLNYYTEDGSWYYNNDSATYADLYGRYYNWDAVMNGEETSDLNPSGVQGICPDGWHVPSDSEWKELEMYLGMSPLEADKEGGARGTDEGGKLKSTGTSLWDSPNTGATDEYGFSALPAGFSTGSYNTSMGRSATFRTSTEVLPESVRPEYAYIRSLSNNNARIGRFEVASKLGGWSLRCVKD